MRTNKQETTIEAIRRQRHFPLLAFYQLHTEPIVSLEWAVNGQHVYSGCKGGLVVHLCLTQGKCSDNENKNQNSMVALPGSSVLEAMLSILGEDDETNEKAYEQQMTKIDGSNEISQFPQMNVTEVMRAKGPIKQLHCGITEDPELGKMVLLLVNVSSVECKGTNNSDTVVLLQFPQSPNAIPRRRDLSRSIGKSASACFLCSSNSEYSTGIVAVSTHCPQSLIVPPQSSHLGVHFLDTDGSWQHCVQLQPSNSACLPINCSQLLPVGGLTHTLILLTGDPDYLVLSLDLLQRKFGPLENASDANRPLVSRACTTYTSCLPMIITLAAHMHFNGKDIVTVDAFSCIQSVVLADTKVNSTTVYPRRLLGGVVEFQKLWRVRQEKKRAQEKYIDGKFTIHSAFHMMPRKSVNESVEHFTNETQSLEREPFPLFMPFPLHDLQRKLNIISSSAEEIDQFPYINADFMSIAAPVEVLAMAPASTQQESSEATSELFIRDTPAISWLLNWEDMGCYRDEQEGSWMQHFPAQRLCQGREDTSHVSGRHIHAEAFFACRTKDSKNSLAESILHGQPEHLLNIKGRMVRKRSLRQTHKPYQRIVSERPMTSVSEEAALSALKYETNVINSNRVPYRSMYANLEEHYVSIEMEKDRVFDVTECTGDDSLALEEGTMFVAVDSGSDDDEFELHQKESNIVKEEKPPVLERPFKNEDTTEETNSTILARSNLPVLSANPSYRGQLSAEQVCPRGVSAYISSFLLARGLWEDKKTNRNNQTWNDCESDDDVSQTRPSFNKSPWAKRLEKKEEWGDTWGDAGTEDSDLEIESKM